MKFSEEIETRGFKTIESYKKKIKFIKDKLGIKLTYEELEIEEANKFNLLDTADEFLKPE